jgi:hypothetical protein
MKIVRFVVMPLSDEQRSKFLFAYSSNFKKYPIVVAQRLRKSITNTTFSGQDFILRLRIVVNGK